MAYSEKLNKPLPYLEWVQTVSSSVSTEPDLFRKYNEYVNDWYKSKDASVATDKSIIVGLYKDLLKQITLNYTTVDEQRFLSNINYDDPAELDIIVPYFATKIKHVTQYLVDKKNEVKFVNIKNSIKGSEFGVESAVKTKIISLLSDQEFTSRYPDSVVTTVSAAALKMSVDIEPLYDVYQHYYDIDPNIPGSIYDPKSDAARILQLFSNTEERNYKVWLDLTGAIEDVYKEIPLLLATECTALNSYSGHSISLNVTRNSIDDLPLHYFVNGEVSEDQLVVNYQKQLGEKYAGTKMVYLSTGSTTTNFVTGELFDPKHKSPNLLNRYYSSHPVVPCTTQLRSVQDIGGFFIPTKLGISNYSSLRSYYTLNKDKLLPGTVYVFPDPDVYGAGRGNTKTDQPSVYDHTDDVTTIKGSRANVKLQGDVVDDINVQKFYPYQSREETLQQQPQGISRSSDNIDFWAGDTKDIWADADRYPVVPLEALPIQAKRDDLLISDDVIYRWKTDLYGNEYALYKSTHPQRKTSNQALNTNLVSSATQSTDTHVQNITADLFANRTNYYNYQLSGFTTVEESRVSTAQPATIDQKSSAAQTKFYFRNSHSTGISPISSALSGVFIKYSGTDILEEINNDIRDFDVIKDYLILQTSNFTVVEKISQNAQTDKYTSDLSKQVYISLSGSNNNYEKFGNWWYHEADNSIFLNKTVLHPFLSGSNYKIVYPAIYKFNLTDHTFSNMYSVNTLVTGDDVNNNEKIYNTLSAQGFTLSGTGEELNILSVDEPSISYNELDKAYTVSMLGKGVNLESYLYNIYFDTSNKLTFAVDRVVLFKPFFGAYNYNVHNFSINPTTGEPSLSANLEGELQRGNKEENFKFSTTGWSSNVNLPGLEETTAGYIAFGGLSGRVGPVVDKLIDTNNNTAVMGHGLSSENGQVLSAANFVNGTTVAPYTHNNSYILSNISLSADVDISVCFDAALYTNTTSNSAYAMLSSKSPILSSFSGTEQPGDGLCVFFFDSDYDIFPAGVASALGYTNYSGPLFYDAATADYTSINGVRGGYIGVGFDIRGHFGNLTDGKTGDTISAFPQASAYPYSGTITCTTTQALSAKAAPNTLTVRSSERLGYKVLSTTANLSTYPISGSTKYTSSPAVTLHQSVTSRDDVVFNRFRVSLLNKSKRLAVDILNSADSKFYPYQIVDLDGSNIPTQLRAGIAFSTSHAFTNCEIKNVGIYGDGQDYSKSVSNLAPLTGAAFTVTTAV